MKLPIAWLRDYVDVTLETDALAERFATLGFPVDDIVRRPRLSGIAVGRLVRVEKHPNADKLQICTVDVAGPRALTIATAATNVAEGDVVPVATIGAKVVGLEIGPRKMRGVDSEGMLCSANEVGFPEEWFDDGILQLERTLEPGGDFVEMFRLNDDVIDVEVTANRPDALSVLGLARELAASLGAAIREPAPARAPAGGDTGGARVVLESPDCKRFVAQRFSNVPHGAAPFWMRSRLALAGQRPISHLIDISNFVMLETAQPLHFYDFAHVAGGTLVARDARAGERVRTLDGNDRTLDPRFLVIADEREPQSIAGLMGAAPTEIGDATNELLVEAAAFDGPRVRRMSVALGLRTEASTRHEKDLSLGLTTFGAARAAMLLEAAGARAFAPLVVGADDTAAPPIALPVARCRELLGIDITASEATAALERLGFGVRIDGDALAVMPPFWRTDVRIGEDVVEEIARIVGYDRIVAELPAIAPSNVSSAAYRDERRIAHALAARGYREALTLALQPAGIARRFADAGLAPALPAVEIQNPLSEDQRFLRFSLLPGLLELAARFGNDEPYRTFEIGHVFEAGERLAEVAGAAWLLTLPRSDAPPWRDDGFLRFKGESLALVRALTGRDVETVSASAPGWHPGKTASLLVEGKDVARVGAVDPRLLATFGIERRAYAGWMRCADLPPYESPRYRAASRFPSVERDLALIVAPHVAAIDIEHAVRAGANGAARTVRVFDEYRGPQIADGKKSIAVRVTLQRADATLTDAEAECHVAAILASLAERCGATIRT